MIKDKDKEREKEAEAARRRFYAGRLPLFEQIAYVFLSTVASHQKRDELFTVSKYLDGAIKIDGASHRRRDFVLAIEESKQRIAAPSDLRSEVIARMRLLKLDPIPELKFFRDIATAILRMDVALRLMGLDFQPRSLRFDAIQAQPAIEPFAKTGNSGSGHRRRRKVSLIRTESGALEAIGAHLGGRLQRARWRRVRRSSSFALQRRSHSTA